MHLDGKDRNVGRAKLLADVTQQTRPDHGAGAGEQHRVRNAPGKGPFLLTDELDGFCRLGRIELAALDRDDHQVSPADRISHGHAGRALQVDDDERHLRRPSLDVVDNRRLGHVGDDGEVRGFALQPAPFGHGTIGVGVDDHDIGAGPREFGREHHGTGRLASASLRAGKHNGWHLSATRNLSRTNKCAARNRKVNG